MTYPRSRPVNMRTELVPDGLIPVPDELIEARGRAAAAIDSFEQAREAHIEAKRAAEAAPKADAEAKYGALEAGRKPPAATAPAAEEAAEDARILVDVATNRADAALAEMRAVRDAHRDELIATATEAGERELVGVREALESVTSGFGRLAELAGVVTAVHTGDAWKRASTALRNGPNIDPLLSELHGAAETLWENAVPLETRIVEAVGPNGATWDELCERIGRHVLDPDACTIRARLVKQGRLSYTAELGDGRDRKLVQSTPPETSAERSRRLRREREAA